MTNKQRTTATTYLLIGTLLFPTLIFGQQAAKADAAKTSAIENTTSASPEYLLEVPAGYDTSQEYSREAQAIANVLSSNTAKSPILIDNQGFAREMVLQSVAARLAPIANGKKLFRINWNALLSADKEQSQIDAVLTGVLRDVAASKGKTVIYLDDISTFSSETPVLGSHVAGIIYNAILNSKIQILSASESSSFERQIAADARLAPRFQRIDIVKDNDDGFVGDKLSPDLRALVAGTDRNKVVKVILQSDDINNPELISVLNRNGVLVSDRATSLNMLTIDLPVRVAEEVAAVQSARHLSLVKPTLSLGHLEATTGITAMRAVAGNSAINGAGVGIAIVDSGVYRDHYMFYNNAGGKRAEEHKEFVGGGDDKFGHGTHVAAIAAGRGGRPGDPLSTGYLQNYQGVAPEAMVIRVKVLTDQGAGTTAGLLSALDWIYTNRITKNIKVVNLSLGTPALESYRNDPLCRATRKLVDAGVVVVAAAGNNGKNAAGEKIYGAIHSPGNEPSVITVGATNSFGTDTRSDDAIATYSSRGPTRSYYTDANGVKTYDHVLKPEVVAPGNKIVSARSRDNLLASNNPALDIGVALDGTDDKTQLMYLSGTSMSTPVVSGAAALLLQANPKLTPNMVKLILMYTAQPIAGFNHLEQGAGQINIEGAVRLAKLVRQDLTASTALGTPMLTTALPVQQSTIVGETSLWSQGMIFDRGYASGSNLIMDYQRAYGIGILVGDCILNRDGILVGDGIATESGRRRNSGR